MGTGLKECILSGLLSVDGLKSNLLEAEIPNQFSIILSVAKDTHKRVVGVLLGSTFKGTVDVTNSYAVVQLRLSETSSSSCCWVRFHFPKMFHG
ncbi:hypothetical protein ACB098_01G165600 [Castanea mollissima]